MDIYYLSSSCLFNRTNHCITNEKHQLIHQLTPFQFETLEYLLKNRGTVLTYKIIIGTVWEYNGIEKNVMDIVSQLRKIDPCLRKCIKTKRGVGFIFECDYPQPKQSISDQIQIISSRKLDTFGYTPITAAQQLVNNDMELFGDLGDNEGDATIWAKFIQAFPDTFFCALNENNEIVGNWSFCSPHDEQLELIRQGQVKESEFHLKNINYINFPDSKGYYDGFILNFSLIRQYRTVTNEHLLFDSFAGQLWEWATAGIYFRYIYVNVFTEDQEQLYKSLGFAKICPNNPHGIIYMLNLLDFPKNQLWNRHDNLQNLYNSYFSGFEQGSVL